MNKKVNVYLMCIIVFLQGFVFYGPVATLYRQNRNLSLSDMFLIESISWILMIVFYKADSFGMFFLERVLLAVSLAGISGCDIALIYSSVKEEESEKVFGIYNAFSTSGYLIASIMFSIIIKQSMDSTAFWTIIPYAIAAILTLI